MHNGYKMKEAMFNIDTSKNSLLRVMSHWNTLPRQIVGAQSLFMASLDGALSNLVLWKVSLFTAGGLALDHF